MRGMLNGFDRKVEEMKMKGESNFYATQICALSAVLPNMSVRGDLYEL